MDRTEPAGINPFEGIDPPLASGDLAVVNIEGDCERHEGTSPYDPTPPEGTSGSAAQPDAELRHFSGRQFKELLDSMSLPNLTDMADAPAITGDAQTDARIRRIAEERGYALQPVVASRDELQPVEQKLLQADAARAYLALREAARQAGHPIMLNSGYRDFEVQKYLLLRRLKPPYADPEIHAALRVVAPPGYSRHQT